MFAVKTRILNLLQLNKINKKKIRYFLKITVDVRSYQMTPSCTWIDSITTVSMSDTHKFTRLYF